MKIIKPQIPLPETELHLKKFIAKLSRKRLSIKDREELILWAFLEGHVPSYMRNFVDVTTTFNDVNKIAHTLILKVLPDYLTIGLEGTTDYFLRMPMMATTAQKIADAYQCMLPTVKISKIIWNESTKLHAMPWAPQPLADMQKMDRYVDHNIVINRCMNKIRADRSKLTAGHKKDIVITNHLLIRPKQVAIYGWHQDNGEPIQPLYLGHNSTYVDYSFGARLVSQKCILDGKITDLEKVMSSKKYWIAVSNEGPMKIFRQP